MIKKYEVFKNFYRDSVTLMQMSSKVNGIDGVTLASGLMGTPANIAMMMEAGLLDETPAGVAPSDLIFAVKCEEKAADEVFEAFKKLMTDADVKKDKKQDEEPPKSLTEALAINSGANVALISVSGTYAYAEAMKALKNGLNVMIFSDNVSEDEEIKLKKYAIEKNLLVMGPDCGTAIIAGVPLAFANVVSKGKIGVVGASGTGTQEVTTLIDRNGEGVSHAIGTGGHDLSEKVGGMTMLAGLKVLTDDPTTEVIVLVSKPPSKVVADKILKQAQLANKPVVVCFLGANPEDIKGGNLTVAVTLEEAAIKAVALSRKKQPDFKSKTSTDAKVQAEAKKIRTVLKPTQKYIRGLYSGGTFCYEALLNLQKTVDDIYSNIPTGKVKKLDNPFKSQLNTVIDLGDDIFTRGKPHPMIDPYERNLRLVEEAKDPETAVILIDVVIGYGANADPAGEVVKAIVQAKEIAKKDNREIVFISFVCGTNKDNQGLEAQMKKLSDVGVHLFESNVQAVAMAGAILKNG